METLPWQQQLWLSLATSASENILPHAILLHGPVGIGKHHLATQLAHRLLCLDSSDLSECGHCRSCHLLQGGEHPDLYRVAPEGKGRQIGIDKIRKLSENLVLRPQISPNKVAIIEEAESLNPYSANALLKTLEEPPADTHIIMVTAHPSRLLATIRSRCYQLRCTTGSYSRSAEWLSSQGVPPLEALPLIEQTSGAAFKALEFHQQQSGELLDEAAQQLVLLSRGATTAIKVAKVWVAREDRLYLEWYYRTIANVLRCNITGREPHHSSQHQQQLLSWLSQRGDRELLELMEGIKQVLRLWGGQVNQTLLLEGLMLRWQRL